MNIASELWINHYLEWHNVLSYDPKHYPKAAVLLLENEKKKDILEETRRNCALMNVTCTIDDRESGSRFVGKEIQMNWVVKHNEMF